MDFNKIITKCQENLIGLDTEIEIILNAIENQISVVIEGESGTGKTELAKTLAFALDRPFYRVDGDENLTISKIRGWFDPPLVIQSGFNDKSFIAGPLVQAMQHGGLFFFNEVNRAPSESINGVLAVMDERQIQIPQLDRLKADNKFYSLFTLNPLEYVGTNPLPEAFFDRCILIKLKHKSGEEAKQIIKMRTNCSNDELISKVTLFTEKTRNSPDFETGGSIRAAIQLTLLLKNRTIIPKTILAAINAVFSAKVKLHPDISKSVEDCLIEIAEPIFFPDNIKKFQGGT
ncbi:MAG: AAA family ATPase [Candidatus Hodarchaeales archaeon]|jgi:MoxR-like ATPase